MLCLCNHTCFHLVKARWKTISATSAAQTFTLICFDIKSDPSHEASSTCRKLHSSFGLLRWAPEHVAASCSQPISSSWASVRRWSAATSWALHQQMELYWWGWSEGLQMEDAVSVLPRGHSTRPLLQPSFSASLQTSPVVSFRHLTSPAATQMAPLSNQRGSFTHTRTGSRTEEATIIISGDNWRKGEKVMATLMGHFIWESCICANNSHNSIWDKKRKERHAWQDEPH